jgi:crotonobetainyl-CoA:carnitine CoA-transferase CaiB-like acyl-CoA transferase
MSLLSGLRVLEVGPGLAAAVAGRLFSDLGAQVRSLQADASAPLSLHLDHGKARAESVDAVAEADIVLIAGQPADLAARGLDPASLQALNPKAVLAYIAPYGQSGPATGRPASDLTLFAASGIARLLTGQVDDLAEAPVRPVGEQSAFIAGLAAAAPAMHAALLAGPGAVIDVSAQEALAGLAVSELARAGQQRRAWSRQRLADGNGATVCILPASDGYAAISPRETHQWAAWLKVMGDPAWGAEPRFAGMADRIKNWDALHALMSAWSRQHRKRQIVELAQQARVPSLPLSELAEQLDSTQLAHRDFFREIEIDGRTVKAPGPPFGLGALDETKGEAAPAPGPLPLSGLRVLDFSWVIAGPTTTRYLAAMGAEVIKVEAPGRGDPGRGSELHSVVGQAKRAIVLDLKQPAAVEVARVLAAHSDMVVENFATGVMERLGLGAGELRAANPGLIYLSASGFGRTGPEASRAAYGTLLQCHAGFAGLNGHPGIAPRIGFAWLDPMCALMLAFVTAAALWRRQRTGSGCRIDVSMLEAMLWTLAEPLLETQLGRPPRRRGNDSDRHAPHNVYRAKGEDAWLAVAVTDDTHWRALTATVPGLSELAGLSAADRRACRADLDARLAEWMAGQDADAAEMLLLAAGVPAAKVASSLDLADSAHLAARGFWDTDRMPGLPWRASFGRRTGPAPGLGADTEAVLADDLGMSAAEIAKLRQAGALG